ncbi:MAG: hypothetical protein ACYCST_15120 [Acidimicrobiales bacterium]
MTPLRRHRFVSKEAELSRYKLGRIATDDQDGSHRVMCPAEMGKLRCPQRTSYVALPYAHTEVLAPPEHPPRWSTQVTVTVAPTVNAKTTQHHDYPSRAWCRSYARRSAAERSSA